MGEDSDVCSNELTDDEINELYDKTVPMTKGYRYGYGSMANSSSSRSLPPPGYVPEEAFRLSQQALERTEHNYKHLDSKLGDLTSFLQAQFHGKTIPGITDQTDHSDERTNTDNLDV